jgi:hypothetical protein
LKRTGPGLVAPLAVIIGGIGMKVTGDMADAHTATIGSTMLGVCSLGLTGAGAAALVFSNGFPRLRLGFKQFRQTDLPVLRQKHTNRMAILRHGHC